MAKTIALNSLETVWVTSYSGGAGVGTLFDISMQRDGETQVTATFSVKDLLKILEDHGSIKGLAKPEFDTIPRPQSENIEGVYSGERFTPSHTHVWDLTISNNHVKHTTVGAFEGEDIIEPHSHSWIAGQKYTNAASGHRHPVSEGGTAIGRAVVD